MSVSWVKLSLGVVGQIMPQVQVARRVLSCIAPIRRNYPRQSRRRSIGKPVLDEIILLDSERAVRSSYRIRPSSVRDDCGKWRGNGCAFPALVGSFSYLFIDPSLASL